jgi:hypothetical protein
MASNRITQNQDASKEALALHQFLQILTQATGRAEALDRIQGSVSLGGDYTAFNALFGLPAPTPGSEDAEYNLVVGAIGQFANSGPIRSLLERMGKGA